MMDDKLLPLTASKDFTTQKIEQKVASNLPLARQMAEDWVNVLSVVPVPHDDGTLSFLIMFEYRFEAPRLDGWRKYAIRWQGQVQDGVACCYELARQLKEAIENDPKWQ